jgi:hypothetical protein
MMTARHLRKDEFRSRNAKGLSRLNKEQRMDMLHHLLSNPMPMVTAPIEQAAVERPPPILNNAAPRLSGFADGAHWVELNPELVPVEEPVLNFHQPTVSTEDAPYLSPKFNYQEKFDRSVFTAQKWVPVLNNGKISRDRKTGEIVTKEIESITITLKYF